MNKTQSNENDHSCVFQGYQYELHVILEFY